MGGDLQNICGSVLHMAFRGEGQESVPWVRHRWENGKQVSGKSNSHLFIVEGNTVRIAHLF